MSLDNLPTEFPPCPSLPVHEQALSVLCFRSADLILVPPSLHRHRSSAQGDCGISRSQPTALLVSHTQVCWIVHSYQCPLYVRGESITIKYYNMNYYLTSFTINQGYYFNNNSGR